MISEASNEFSDVTCAEPDYALLRRLMVEQQLRARGIHDPKVLRAMSRVPREEFVTRDLREVAYDDHPLPIGQGQTISQPFTVAWMVQAMGLDGHEKVLEVGAGSGYGAAVLAEIARSVISIECLPEIAWDARRRLERLGYDNIDVRLGDGSVGLPEEAPFDAIMVTAAAQALPPVLLSQLGEGGRLVIPLGSDRHHQTLYRFTRTGDQVTLDDLGPFSFVPLIGRHGWREPGRDGD